DMSCVEIAQKRKLKNTIGRCKNPETHSFEYYSKIGFIIINNIEYKFSNNILQDIMISCLEYRSTDYIHIVDFFMHLYGTPDEYQMKWKNPDLKSKLAYREIIKHSHNIKYYSTIWHINDGSGLDLYWSQYGISIFIYSPEEWKKQTAKGNYQSISK
ncbi:MAG: hypothetical protein JW737_07470, partial [Acidobacteria bacterium]|nr:hypothetical protein [Acidobacteriota bacterium]